ncbi:MAG: hypothetical protein CL708_04300 [Chloroflexi bacterium]|nr:hypothetical protein [Chloroflexota bacterium]MDC0047160.1 hypothetical protein [Chloroflexota bacterium]|tara:strand:+ start:8317 stop:8748 length:432 start_codon:yes stop_codon:yes gene_type:complete
MTSKDKIKYSIKLNNLEENEKKSLSLLLHTRIQEIKNEKEDFKINKLEDPQVYLNKLSELYKKSSSFLEPKTPVKEALFRLFVFNGNKPLTLKQINKNLSENWEMSQFPRDISIEKLSSLIKNVSDYYIQPYGRKFNKSSLPF